MNKDAGAVHLKADISAGKERKDNRTDRWANKK